MRLCPAQWRDQRGLSLSVWTAVAMPALIVAVGLGVDFSGHAAAKQEAREVAAQAARAAVQQITVTESGTRIDQGAATHAGREFARRAGFIATVEIRAGGTAEVTITGSYPTLFLGVIGISSIGYDVSASAAAISTVDGEPA